MFPYDNIVWQPTHLHQPHHDFKIYLKSDFAKEMLETTITHEIERQMNEHGKGLLKRLGYSSSSPYIFHEDTALVTQLNLDAGRGTWLSLNTHFGALPDLSKEEFIVYDTHNMDTSSDTKALLALFDMYVYYSKLLKG